MHEIHVPNYYKKPVVCKLWNMTHCPHSVLEIYNYRRV